MLSDKARELLTNARGFGFLGTTSRDGSAHVTPIWVDTEGDTVCFNTSERRVKTRHLRRDPRACLTLLDLDHPYEYVELRRRVRMLTGPEDEQHFDRLARKTSAPGRIRGGWKARRASSASSTSTTSAVRKAAKAKTHA